MIPIVITAIEDYDDRMFMTDLYDRFHSIMFYRAADIVRDLDAAEDVVQDAIVKLIDKLPVLKEIPETKLAAYVVLTTKSVAIDHYNKNRSVNKHTYYSIDDEEKPEIPDLSALPEETVIALETRAKLRSAITCLPQQERDILVYKYFLDMRDSEIAELFGIKPGSVRTYLTRARRHARALMEEGSKNGER